jgi:alkylresorcinol/alkylpyrone synthase
MSKIVSISTAVPKHKHEQKSLLTFMQKAYGMNEAESRKLKFLYEQSGIDSRYSVLPDYSAPHSDWGFYPTTEDLEPFPGLEVRMKWYNNTSPSLSIEAIEKCIDGKIKREDITHLITVSCTGMTAPGLELQIIEEMQLSKNISRTSVNFMGCYAAIHALKMADAICKHNNDASVLIVCTELCTLHFQKDNKPDNITSSLLFGDGAAAVLVTGDNSSHSGPRIKSFHSEITLKGKDHMRWELSSAGFLMTLSHEIPQLIEEHFEEIASNAIEKAGLSKKDISYWCIHPGGKKILSAVEKSVPLTHEDLKYSYNVLKEYGNMSSPTILFVLKDILENANGESKNIFGAAFGPGLTTETFILSN